MNPSLFPLLICVVLLLSVAPASSQDSSVLISQAGSAREPFDVSGAVTFSVPVVNSAGGSMRYTVDLTVGPDTDDYQVSDSFTKVITVNARSSSSAKFDVNFRSPKMSKGEFGKWASDKNDTTTWERAWYHAEITPLIGSTTVIENYDGHPKLVKVSFDYKGAEVSPRQGTGSDSYTYKVTALGSYQDNITLQVGPSRDGPWTDLKSRQYSTPGVSQVLTWENQSLSFDFNVGYYRFSGRKQSNVFEGPFWPVTLSYSNNSVNPVKGLSDEPFTYILDLNASKSIDVVLNVLDVNSKTFIPAGRLTYKNASRWQTLKWENVHPSEIAGSEGSSFYYFEFYYVGSETPFSSTYEQDNSYFRGPEIVVVNFRNATVTPGNGSSLTPYTYCVDVVTSLPVCDIDLQTSATGSSLWKSQGITTYDGSSKRICWSDVVLDSDLKGEMKYRFIRVGSTPEEYQGPSLETIDVTSWVEPSNASLGYTTTAPIQEKHTYVAEIAKAGTHDPMLVSLEVFDPAKSSWIPAGQQRYDFSHRYLNFTLDALPFTSLFLNESKYRFLSDDKVLGEFSGPAVDVNFRNLSYSVKDDKYTYMVDVRSSQKSIGIDLIYTVDGVTWFEANDVKPYASDSAEWKKITWSDKDWYSKIDAIAVREDKL